MRFSHLKLDGFRNLAKTELDFNNKFTVIFGENASGKTSLLEALYFITHAKSFRTSSLKYLMQHDYSHLSLFAKLQQGEMVYPLGVERSQAGRIRIKYNGEKLSSMTRLLAGLPVQFLDTDAHRTFASSPGNRRKLLDWGVFHVEPGFVSAWQDYQKALKQRNCMLKNSASEYSLSPWTEQLVKSGTIINDCRAFYLEEFAAVFSDVWQQLAPTMTLPQLGFYQGWHDGNLSEALQNAYAQDMRYSYTTVGPHRCDIKLQVDGVSALEVFSQGQQKTLMFALKVAQGVYLYNKLGKEVIYLIDDLPAELDELRLSAVVKTLSAHAKQVFITAIDKNLVMPFLSSNNVDFFHVNSGVIKRD